METTHENSRFRSQLLEKTSVLKSALLARLKYQFLPSATATLATFATVEPSKHSHTKNSTTVLLVVLLASCSTSPSYAEVGIPPFGGNSDFLTGLNKINQLPVFDSFNCVDKVAVNGNNLKQEPRKLLTTVQYHHTLVDVFLCLSFASCLFTGELRLAALWWGGHRNKPFIRQILCAVLLRFSSLPTALYLGRIIKKLLPLEKV